MGKFLGSMVSVGKTVLGSLSRHKAAFTLMLLTVLSVTLRADEVSIPSIGIDVAAYIGAAILLMGGVAGAAVGGYAAFLVVKKALKWLGKALG